jgi:hypothetical protein
MMSGATGWRTSKAAMTRPWLAAAVFLALWLPAPMAQDCREHIRSTTDSLDATRRKMSMTSGESRRHSQAFIEEAERLIDIARQECERATSPLEHSYAIATTLVVQGHLAAAQLLIQGNPF